MRLPGEAGKLEQPCRLERLLFKFFREESSMATATASRKPEVKPAAVEKGDMMAFIYYAKINNRSGSGENVAVNCTNLDNGQEFNVQGSDLIACSMSADQYAGSEKSTKMAMAEMLISSHNRPFTVCFEKANGEMRTLRGRLLKPEGLLGRSLVEDLDLPMDNGDRLRQVDHRTIQWMIVGGTRYTL